MPQLQKVLWTKGVLLNPQHLQTQDRYFENLLAFRLGALTAYAWGFSRLEFDREALAGGVLNLVRGTGLMPDGLVFDIGEADPAPSPLPLAEHWQLDQASMLVSLAIPERTAGRVTVAAKGGERDTRYVAEISLQRDENTGLAEKPIQIARKNFRLVTERESLEGSVSLPVARIRRSQTGIAELDPTFIPSLINIAASSHLVGIMRSLVELMAAKSAALSGMRRQRNLGLADFGVSDVANFWLLYSVNSSLPRFQHLYAARTAHPAAAYAAMTDLAGALMTFATFAQSSDIPEYQHANPSDCFGQLSTLLRRLLESAVPTNYVSLPLRQTEASLYATALDEDRYLAAPHVFLAISAAAKPDELIRQVPRLLKVSSADRIDSLIRRALPGVQLRYVPDPPSSIPLKLKYRYFALERSGEDWDAIRLSRHLAVYVPAELPDPEMELVLLP
jgi:type VI secretion system protein ImpJ